MSISEHIETAERAMEMVAAQVIEGKDVVLLLDSITRLARAYNANTDGGGRTMSAASIRTPCRRRGRSSARRASRGRGSLTILGTASSTPARAWTSDLRGVQGHGQQRDLPLARARRAPHLPAIDIAKSGTRKEEKLIAPNLLGTFQALRRILVQMPPQEAMLKLVDRLNKTKTNEEFFNLVRVGES